MKCPDRIFLQACDKCYGGRVDDITWCADELLHVCNDGEESRDVQYVRQSELLNALDKLEDVIHQSCADDANKLDSRALTSYARGMRLLARYGRIVIDKEAHRRVIAHYPLEQ